LILEMLYAALLIFIMEFADKTMIATVLFGVRSRRYLTVLLISVAAFLSANTIAVILASTISTFLSNRKVLMLIASVAFIVAGLISLRKSSEPTQQSIRLTSIAVFTGIFASELGDKTQLTVLGLTLTFNWVVAILGATIGYTVLNGLVLTLSKKAFEVLKYSEEKVKFYSSLMLIVLGVVIAVITVLNIFPW